MRDDDTPRRPLYARLLRLRHIEPGPALCFLYFEGSIAASVLFALLGLVPWWAILVVPVTVAVMVKFNDIVAGRIMRATARPRPRPGGRSATDHQRPKASGNRMRVGPDSVPPPSGTLPTRTPPSRTPPPTPPTGAPASGVPDSWAGDKPARPAASTSFFEPRSSAGKEPGTDAAADPPAPDGPLPPRPAEVLKPPSRSELRESQTGPVNPPPDLNSAPGTDEGDEADDGEQMRGGRGRARASRQTGPPTRRAGETGRGRRRTR